jgi:glycosyltransferase involved in cell wall biosynthesis
MIFIYELVQTEISHGPFTRAFVQTVAYAFPHEEITIFARASHLAAVLHEPDPLLDQRLKKVAYPAPDVPHGAFWRRMMATFKFLRKTYSPVAAQRPQVVFFSTEPHHIWAVRLFKLFEPGFRCHMVLHGDINSVKNPRSRNPLHRARDYSTALGNGNKPDLRFIVLENHIRTNLAALIPATASVTDVVRHPCMPDNADWQTFTPEAGRMRFGLLGIAGRSKGLDVFSRLAKSVRHDAASRADFRLIGKVQAGNASLDMSGISGPLPFSPEWLPRDVFDSEISALHYVVLPYNMEYYGLSASGVLQDVLRFRKPVIAFDTPVIRELAERFGDIGHICANEEDMAHAANELLANFDAERYARQRQNVDKAYRSRLPDAAAAEYAQVQATCWTTNGQGV